MKFLDNLLNAYNPNLHQKMRNLCKDNDVSINLQEEKKFNSKGK